jgi:SMI1/KNR4 family protein
MNPTLIKKLQDFFQKNPITIGEPSTADELLLVEQTMQLKLDETHRYLLLHYGGVVIRDIRIYGLKNAELVGDETFVELTNDFKEQMSIEAQQYVISVDDMGNPILIDTVTREVILYNHDIGAYEKLFNSLEELILSKLELAN